MKQPDRSHRRLAGADPTGPAPSQRAAIRIRAGRHVEFRAAVTTTPAGLLAIGGLVASILLSTAVLVRAARR